MRNRIYTAAGIFAIALAIVSVLAFTLL